MKKNGTTLTDYWEWYIGMLAVNRFNGLNLVYSSPITYMAPMYAWHVRLDDYPNVKPIGSAKKSSLKTAR